MKLNLLKGCVFFLISLSGMGQAASRDITTKEYVNHIYLAAHQAWPALENVWGTHVYQELRLIIADGNNAWAVDSKKLTKIPYSEIQQRHLPVEYMHYQEIKWTDGRPTIYVSLGTTLPDEEKKRFHSEKEPVPEIFNVATHEAFHFFIQDKKWEGISSGNGSRATLYPAQASPRFYRKNIILSLRSYLNGSQIGLAHARYWYDLWKEKYPDDAREIRITDVYEGSARYVEIAAEIISQGSKFNTPEFKNAFLHKTKKEENLTHTQSSSESYSIGGLSSIILNMRDSKWQSIVQNGTPPLDILLEGITPVKQEPDKNIENEIRVEIEKSNKAYRNAINNYIEDYNNPEVIKFFVSAELLSSFSLSGGFFHTKNIPHDLMVGLSSTAHWTGGSYSFNDIVAADIKKSKKYRGREGFLILYAGNLPPSVKGRLVLKTEKLSLNIPYPNDIGKSHIVYLP